MSTKRSFTLTQWPGEGQTYLPPTHILQLIISAQPDFSDAPSVAEIAAVFDVDDDQVESFITEDAYAWIRSMEIGKRKGDTEKLAYFAHSTIVLYEIAKQHNTPLPVIEQQLVEGLLSESPTVLGEEITPEQRDAVLKSLQQTYRVMVEFLTRACATDAEAYNELPAYQADLAS